MLYNDGKYEEAFQIFSEMKNYKESDFYAAKSLINSIDDFKKVVFDRALDYYKSGNYEEALINFRELGEYQNSQEWVKKCEDAIIRAELAKPISAATQFSVGITNDHKVVSTGFETDKRCDVSDWSDIISISGLGLVTIGLKSDGTVITTDVNLNTSDWSNIVSVSAGYQYVIGLKK
jgi:tetratricopeptide (TPR) repeat protein